MRSVNYVLTTAKLNAIKPADKPVKYADGGGLFVRVSPSGTKAWAYAYSFHGRAREVGLGTFPEVSIKAARDKHFEARSALAAGRDPAQEKKEAKIKARDGDGTFRSVAERWLKAKRLTLAARTAKRIEDAMKRDIYPHLGGMQLTSIKPANVLPIIKAKAAKHPTAAAVIRSIISDIYDTAISQLEAEVNPAAPLRKAIVVPPVTHHRHLTEPQLGAWWNALAACEGQTQTSTINAAKFIALTLCRKTEVLNATWGEIEGLEDEGDNAVNFVIPAARMKMRRDHVVPLPRQAVAILRAQKKLCGGEYIFTTLQSPKKPLNISTLNALFNRVAAADACEFIRNEDGKSDFSPHGLRSTATTILRERGYSRDLVELLLAHAERGVHASYNRAEQLPARKAALAFYADLIDSLAAAARGDNVVVLKRKAA